MLLTFEINPDDSKLIPSYCSIAVEKLNSYDMKLNVKKFITGAVAEKNWHNPGSRCMTRGISWFQWPLMTGRCLSESY